MDNRRDLITGQKLETFARRRQDNAGRALMGYIIIFSQIHPLVVFLRLNLTTMLTLSNRGATLSELISFWDKGS